MPCDKLPDGPEPVVVDVEYVASQDLQVRPPGLPAAAGAALCVAAVSWQPLAGRVWDGWHVA